MGRSRRGGGNRRVLKRDFKQAREDTWQANPNHRPPPKRDGYAPVELENDLFEEYYKIQKIVPEEEWQNFMAVLRQPLPTTFRINGSGKFAADLRDKLEQDFFSRLRTEPLMVETEILEAPRALEWYPDKLAWQFNFSRIQLRKLPILEDIHELLKRENEAGAITRQEAVSMVPPLFLDVRPHHRVLDTCAAPGSKTAQILEMLHAGTAVPPGFVIANDAEAQRCNLLTHQTKRMCSPCLLVTNHDASTFPLITPSGRPKSEGVRFDRILCDVPCSGDGTIRKAPDIWRRWAFGNGNGLHPLQVRIATHAAHLLKVGGRMIYSTCTFNPVENEAVVSELLRRTGGAIRLLDCSNHLPGLRRVGGLKTWQVRDKKGFYATYQEAAAANATKVAPSMFPAEDTASFPLHLCMRILPHHSDTGGFFISVFEKVAELPVPESVPETLPARGPQRAPGTVYASASAPMTADEEGSDGDKENADVAEPEAAAAAAPQEPAGPAADASAQPPAGGPEADPGPEASKPSTVAAAFRDQGLPSWGPRGGGARGRDTGGKWRGIDPVIPFTDQATLQSITEFYGMSDAFPLAAQLVTRSQAEINRPKRLYFVSSGVKELLQTDEAEQLKVTATGLKVFERQESKDVGVSCAYRIAQEGLPLLLPHISRQMVRPTAAEFLRLIDERSVALPPSIIGADNGEGAAANGKPDVGAVPQQEGEVSKEDGAPTAATVQSGGTAPGGSWSHAGNKRVKLVDGQSAAPRIPWSDPDTTQQLFGLSAGCCVCTLRDEEARALGLTEGSVAEGALAASAPLAVCCWRGRTSLNVLVNKGECSQMAEKLGAAILRATAIKAEAKAEAAALQGMEPVDMELGPPECESGDEQPARPVSAVLPEAKAPAFA